MSIYTVSENARNELAKVMEWFKTAKVEPRTRSSSICTDKDRFQICGPLLKELGLHEEGNGYALLRLYGDVTIEKDAGVDTLFFPFGLVKVAGEGLQLGNYMRFKETKYFNASVDCLIVTVPQTTA
ncbi:hypothetical protein KXW98_008309 [Aspergillus fumigatus]|jgi:hypothetical protein|nr:hypothetical protein KXX45_007587 [Aspergillus fumigatus]KAH1282771.1 hypothetical protein KXX48_002704 [Aspergillus fumigatus]KAH1286905.1 hypothetical protein KXX30_008816 [Aspergillus fumigatus]KAH1308982.1 hypothetical protein KXX66_001207 [Aspergillus fumigatus]KAH1316588.1 hypothetical protein KXX47_003191 [Aspergillus fumigatus]